MTTWPALISQLSEDYVRDPNHRLWTEASKYRALNKALTQFQADLERSDMTNEETTTISSVAGQQEYDLPTDFARLSLVRYNNDRLYRTTLKDIKEQYDTMTQWTPDRYYTYENKLWLHSVPSTSWQAIELLYYKTLPDISSSVGSPFPTDCDDALLAYASYKLLAPLYRDRAMASMQDYNVILSALRSRYRVPDENMRMSIDTGRELVGERAIGHNE